MKFLTMAISILTVVLLMIYLSLNITTGHSEEVKNIKEATVKVDGMTCSMCPITIKTALKKLDGVESADVSYKDKEAKVFYLKDKVTVDEIINAIENAGNYKASLILDSKAGT